MDKELLLAKPFADAKKELLDTDIGYIFWDRIEKIFLKAYRDTADFIDSLDECQRVQIANRVYGLKDYFVVEMVITINISEKESIDYFVELLKMHRNRDMVEINL